MHKPNEPAAPGQERDYADRDIPVGKIMLSGLYITIFTVLTFVGIRFLFLHLDRSNEQAQQAVSAFVNQRVLPPETTFERVVTMAVERGKLGDLLFDNLEGLGGHALARAVQVVEKLPPTQALLAIAPLRSVFLAGIVNAAQRMTPASAEII